MGRRALVTGIGGQDGSYLAELLLGHGYEVFGTVLGNPEQYESLAPIRERLRFVELDLEDADGVRRALRDIEPDEVYHLASASFVPASWDDPVATSTAAVASISALLDGVRRERPEARFVNAASAEIFGAPAESPQTERTPVAPLTPYGAGKAFGHFLTGSFRRQYGLHASSAILFNHESPRRSTQFLTRKVTHGAAAISLGLEDELRPGRPVRAPGLGLRGRLRPRVVADGVAGRARRLRDRDRRVAHRRGVRRGGVRRGRGRLARARPLRRVVRARGGRLAGARRRPVEGARPAGLGGGGRVPELVRLMVQADIELLRDQAAQPAVDPIVRVGAGVPGELRRPLEAPLDEAIRVARAPSASLRPVISTDSGSK